MKLSICICTLPERIGKLSNLIYELHKQIKGRTNVEILYLGDCRGRTTGYKRNVLKALAKGKYITFLDDDDMVSSDYVDKIMAEVDKDKDLICYKVEITHDAFGVGEVVYAPNLVDKNNPPNFERRPNHLMVWKKKIIEDVNFPDVTIGEDFHFAKRATKRVSSFIAIDKVLYYYDATKKDE